MNREKKELARRRAEARLGLTDDEIARLDKEEAEEAELVRLARALHARIFPEEYDDVLDSSTDANMRRRGINPVSPQAIETARLFRAELGFKEAYADYTRAGSETLEWTISEMKAGRNSILEALASRRKQDTSAG